MSCKFYGACAHPALGILATQGGNQCALITQSYSPCRMELRGDDPDFERCEFKGSGIAAEFVNFPRKEFIPPKPKY